LFRELVVSHLEKHAGIKIVEMRSLSPLEELSTRQLSGLALKD